MFLLVKRFAIGICSGRWRRGWREDDAFRRRRRPFWGVRDRPVGFSGPLARGPTDGGAGGYVPDIANGDPPAGDVPAAAHLAGVPVDGATPTRTARRRRTIDGPRNRCLTAGRESSKNLVPTFGQRSTVDARWAQSTTCSSSGSGLRTRRISEKCAQSGSARPRRSTPSSRRDSPTRTAAPAPASSTTGWPRPRAASP